MFSMFKGSLKLQEKCFLANIAIISHQGMGGRERGLLSSIVSQVAVTEGQGGGQGSRGGIWAEFPRKERSLNHL